MTTTMDKTRVAWSKEHLLAQQQWALGAQGDHWRSWQSDALAAFLKQGFPTRKQEAWKYLPMHGLTTTQYVMSAEGHQDQTTVSAQCNDYFIDDVYRIVVWDGQFCEAASTITDCPAGLVVQSLSSMDSAAAQACLGDMTNEDPLVALNAGLLADGLFVKISKDLVLNKPIHVLHIHSGQQEDQMAHVRHIIQVGRGAEVSVIEDYVSLSDGHYFNNIVTQMMVGDNACCQHYYWQRESNQAYHLHHTNYHLSRDSALQRFEVIIGGAVARAHGNMQLSAPGAEVLCYGCYCASSDQHQDIDLVLDHDASNTRSTQYYRGLVNDSASAAFAGIAKVKKGIESVVAEQTNNNLLLSERAQAYTRPQLEILSEDVTCSHGATIGALDESVLFYMKSRGLSEACARQLLLKSFVSEVYEACDNERLREMMMSMIQASVVS